jgi:hypothetical protein
MADMTTAKKLYRIFNWASLAALLVVILLVLHKSPPPSVTYDPTAAKRVEQKFAAADQAKASGGSAQVQIDRTELNSYLEQNLQMPGSPAPASAAVSVPVAATAGVTTGSTADANGSPAGSASNDPMAALASNDPQTIEQVQSSVKDVKVDMDGDLVKAYVVFNFHGKDLSLELDGHLGAENGYVKFEPVAGKLGSLPLPQSTLDSAVAKLMASPENREKLKLPDDISDIQIVNGKAVVSYK